MARVATGADVVVSLDDTHTLAQCAAPKETSVQHAARAVAALARCARGSDRARGLRARGLRRDVMRSIRAIDIQNLQRSISPVAAGKRDNALQRTFGTRGTSGGSPSRAAGSWLALAFLANPHEYRPPRCKKRTESTPCLPTIQMYHRRVDLVGRRSPTTCGSRSVVAGCASAPQAAMAAHSMSAIRTTQPLPEAERPASGQGQTPLTAFDDLRVEAYE